MISQQTLKQRLQALAPAGFEPMPANGLRPLLDAMTAHIGALDPVLRDDLIYPAFAAWITKDCLPEPLLRKLFTAALDEQHLFHGIGETGTATVYTRTFSLLLLALLLDSHRRRPYLKPAEVKLAHRQVLDYAARERDFRGYHPEEGWSHAAAHCADVLDELARCTELDADDLGTLLVTVRALAGNPVPYTHQEDERLSVAVAGVMPCGAIPPEIWAAWVDSFRGLVEAPGEFPETYYRRVNTIHFLRSLYFRLRRPGLEADPALKALLLERIDQVLAKITRF